MIIYRFEKDGIGPYVGYVDLKVTTMSVGVTNKFAKKKALRVRAELGIDPEKWSRAHSDKTMLYGCPSKEALRAFFGYSFKALFAAGFKIKKYDIPDDEVINVGIECAFPVKYSRFRTMKQLNKAVYKVRNH